MPTPPTPFSPRLAARPLALPETRARAAGTLAMLLVLFIGTAADAATLRADHPLLGTWRLAMPDGSCTETYMVRRDGSTMVTSGDEVAQSEFEISDKPSAKGFYRWTDTLVKDNGKQDCLGEVMETGKTVTNFILFNDANDKFLLCGAEEIRSCIGPAIRVEDNDI